MKRRLWLAWLLLVCSIALAESPAPTSPEPSTPRSPLAELASQIGPGPYSREQVRALLLAADQEIAETATRAAAEAVKPVLIQLAGGRAELELTAKRLRRWQIGAPAVAIVAWLLGCLTVTIAAGIRPP